MEGGSTELQILISPLCTGVTTGLPGSYLVLPLHEPLESLLGVQLPSPRQDGDGRGQHDRDGVGVVGVCADLGVLGRDLVDVEIVVVVVPVVLVVVDVGHHIGHHVEDGHDSPEEGHLTDA